MTRKDTVYASVKITNTGKVRGDEIVQLYIHDEVCSLVRPEKELKGFYRVTLEPGASETVRLPITARSLEFWKNGYWITEPGGFSVMVGSSSEKLKSVRLELK
jgi:beta-glucosidase